MNKQSISGNYSKDTDRTELEGRHLLDHHQLHQNLEGQPDRLVPELREVQQDRGVRGGQEALEYQEVQQDRGVPADQGAQGVQGVPADRPLLVGQEVLADQQHRSGQSSLEIQAEE